MLRRHDRLHPYPIVLLRRAEDTHRLDAIVAMLQRCAELEPPVRFARHRGDDMTWAISELDVEWLRKTLDMGDDPLQKLVGRLAVMTDHDEPVKLTYWREFRWRPFRYELVSIDVPWAPRRDDRPVLRTRDQLLGLLREAAVAFGADVAGLYPRSLHALVRLASGELAGRATDPDNGGSRASNQRVPAFVSQLPEGVFERFASLRPPRTFDVAAVPESVWWANVWSRDVVERLGRQRIESLPWARCEPAGDGGLFLLSSKHRPGPKKPSALEAIAALIEGLDLPAQQRAAQP